MAVRQPQRLQGIKTKAGRFGEGHINDTFRAVDGEGAGGALPGAEIRYLPWGAKLMTLERGIRFLTGHLEGDHYFHISRPGQNLDRTRTQRKLVADMEGRWDELNAIVARYLPR